MVCWFHLQSPETADTSSEISIAVAFAVEATALRALSLRALTSKSSRLRCERADTEMLQSVASPKRGHG